MMVKEKVHWYIDRLKAMSLQEVFWRSEQKRISIYEKSKYTKRDYFITDPDLFHKKNTVQTQNYDINRFFLCENRRLSRNIQQNSSIVLFEQFKVNPHAINWHAGFLTENDWPMMFSYDIAYKQNDLIGDARVNWELNRHYLLQKLSKQYYLTQDEKILATLVKLFNEWNQQNPFLRGISWTSIMEVAIRSLSWLISLWFIEKTNSDRAAFCTELKNGVINQIIYVEQHYSRYSSANNHVIIEMAVLGIAGVVFGVPRWVNLAYDTLVHEFDRQNNRDGVNREQSIHYQAFIMEAIALYMLCMRYNPVYDMQCFIPKLKKMCEFVADLMDCTDGVADIGDSDEGKLLDLSGTNYNYYAYVLQLCGILLGKEYHHAEWNENIFWLFTDTEINKHRIKYFNKYSKCYQYGGYTILKYRDTTMERVLTFDHGPLGFGSIAAHGHADTLSITLSVDGEKIIVDPGTYIYHNQLKWRDYFRKTCNHNTVTLNGADQSEMKGAFLWGKKANAYLVKYIKNMEVDDIEAFHDGYNPVAHHRRIMYVKPDLFIIVDKLENSFNDSFVNTFVLNSNLKVREIHSKLFEIPSGKNKIYFSTSHSMHTEECWVSKMYLKKEKSTALKMKGNTSTAKRFVTCVSINKIALIADDRIYFDHKKICLKEDL